MKNVALVTAIGSFSGEIVIDKINEYGFDVIGTDIYPREYVVNSLFVSRFYQVPKVEDEKEYEKVILDICNQEKVTHILPLTDVEVDYFNARRDIYSRKNITLCISGNSSISICRDKLKQFKYIKANIPQINTIPTVALSDCCEAPFSFPFIAKPIDGRSSKGIYKIDSEEDWKTFKSNRVTKKYIVEPFIEGHVITVDILRQDDMNTVAVAREELLRTFNGAGLSVRVYHDPELEAACQALACAFNIVGCACFEFIQDPSGKYKYLECNPRFSAGVKFSKMAGYDFITNHLRCFEKIPIEKLNSIQETYIARRYEEYITSE